MTPRFPKNVSNWLSLLGNAVPPRDPNDEDEDDEDDEDEEEDREPAVQNQMKTNRQVRRSCYCAVPQN
jgi:hypothetical protein